jgi:hypothetical protein
MAGACVPLEVVGGIMSFAGSPPPTTLTFTNRFHGPGGSESWTIKVFPAFFELQKFSGDGATTERERWAHSNETTELVKAVVRTWLSANNFYLAVKRGLIHEYVNVYSRDDFDGSYEMFEDGQAHNWEERKSEGCHYLSTPDEPLPKHFARLQQLHQQRREHQLARAHNIAAIFFAAPTHY